MGKTWQHSKMAEELEGGEKERKEGKAEGRGEYNRENKGWAG
jgi:hypothetical protein